MRSAVDPRLVLTPKMHKAVRDEVESFRLEYETFDSEVVEEYVRLLDDFTQYQKMLFMQMLGY